jgi:hypothetical protein
MPTPRSKLSKEVTQGYWAAVSRHIQERFQLSLTKAQQAISNYKKELAQAGVGDVIYHAPIQETVEGIINGGYVSLVSKPTPDSKSKSLKQTLAPRKSQSTRRRSNQKVTAPQGRSLIVPQILHQDQPSRVPQRIDS